MNGSHVNATSRLFDGAYTVDFDQSVASCAVVATIRIVSPFDEPGEINASFPPSAPGVAPVLDRVVIETFNSAGPLGFPPARSDRYFSVAVFC